MSETSEAPLPTQTAAPPTVPPKQPIVGLTLADDHDARRRQFEDMRQKMDALQRDMQALIAQLHARRYPPAGPDPDA